LTQGPPAGSRWPKDTSAGEARRRNTAVSRTFGVIKISGGTPSGTARSGSGSMSSIGGRILCHPSQTRQAVQLRQTVRCETREMQLQIGISSDFAAGNKLHGIKLIPRDAQGQGRASIPPLRDGRASHRSSRTTDADIGLLTKSRPLFTNRDVPVGTAGTALEHPVPDRMASQGTTIVTSFDGVLVPHALRPRTRTK